MTRVALIAGVVYIGTAGIAYDEVGVAGLAVSAMWAAAAAVVVDRAATGLSWKAATRAVIAAFVIAIAVFALLYPRLDSDVPGRGVDRDDDADVAVRAAARGDFPFGERTYLGNRITHLPGSLVVAAPFVAAGGSALENLVVVPIAVLVLARRTRSAEVIVVTVGTSLASIGVLHEFVTGGNTLAEWSLLCLATAWLLGRPTSLWRHLAVGFALNIRTNAWVAAAAPVGAVARRSWPRALRLGAAVVAVQLVLIGPFIVGGLDRFTPLTGGAGKFAHFDLLFAHASVVVPAIAVVSGAVAAFGVARSQRVAEVPAALAGLAASQLVQFGVLLAASAVADQHAWVIDWMRYLTLAVIPAAVAIALGSTPPVETKAA